MMFLMSSTGVVIMAILFAYFFGIGSLEVFFLLLKRRADNQLKKLSEESAKK